MNPAAGRVHPAAPMLSMVERTLDDLVRTQLPRLHVLCGELRREVVAADADALADAMREHLGAATALAFELLVARGLRAAASRADEAAFRIQVQWLVDATAETWSQLRTYLAASAGAAARSDMLLSEFIMQARAVQRRAGECDAPLDRAAREPGDARLPALQRLRDALAGACAAASTVRRLMHETEQERAAVHAALQALARALGGGLLERLRPVVAGTGPATREEVDAARAARQDLAEALAAAAARMERLHAARSQVVASLDAMAEATRL